MSAREPRPIRVAFSGSGFKVPAHVGALAAVLDAGYVPVEYAGTSGGSIVAALAACGMPIADMKALALTMDWSDMLTFNPWSLVTKYAYCSGAALMDWLTLKTGGKTFADIDVDLTIMSSDIGRSAPFKWSREETLNAPVALAARASAAIPFVFAPVEYADTIHQDGGMANNIPVMRLKIDEVPRLGVELTAKTAVLQGKPSLMQLAQRDLEIMLASNESTQVLMGTTSGARIAYVETGYANGLDTNMAADVRQRLFTDGYAAAQEVLGALLMT